MSEITETKEVPVATKETNNEKIACNCGKEISKKHLKDHLKTASHLKATEEKEESKPTKDSSLKVKERFDAIDAKLDLLLDMVTEIYEDDYDDEEYVVSTK